MLIGVVIIYNSWFLKMASNIGILQGMDPSHISSLTSEDKVKEIISRLKFIATVKYGEKINVRELFARDNDSVFQRFLRTVRNVGTYIASSENVESKKATLAFIQDTINRTLTLIIAYRSPDDDYKQHISNLLITNLEQSKPGIRNLILTYRGDRKFLSEAEATIQTLEARIKSMHNKGYLEGMTESSFMPHIENSGVYIDCGTTEYDTPDESLL